MLTPEAPASLELVQGSTNEYATGRNRTHQQSETRQQVLRTTEASVHKKAAKLQQHLHEWITAACAGQDRQMRFSS